MPNIFSTAINVLSARRVALHGSADSVHGIANVEIFQDDKDLGSARVAANGDWSFTVAPHQSNQYQPYRAVITDGLGVDSTIDAKFDLALNQPVTGEIMQIGLENNSTHINTYATDGRLLYSGAGMNNAAVDLTLDGHGSSVPFFVFSGAKTEIGNFHSAGAGHDTLNFSATPFDNLAEVLRHTSTFQGNTTIHVDEHTSVKLDGVTKGQLAHHPKVFSFG